MSDEKLTDNEGWRLDSLDEEEDIIELTEEIDPPARMKTANLAQLDEIVIELENGSPPGRDDELHELTEAADGEVDFDEIAPEDETDDFIFGIEQAPDEEAHELMELAAEDTGFAPLESVEDFNGIALDFEDETLPAPDEEAGEMDDGAEVKSNIEELLPPGDDEEIDIAFEDDADPDWEEAVQDLSEPEMEEVGLEELQPVDSAEEIGMPDIETEVDIDEIADLEPIQPPDIPDRQTPVAALQDDLELQEEFASDLFEPMSSATDEIIEISEFDQQYFSEEQTERPLTGRSSVASTDGEDFLELIDAEEAEEDDHELDEDIIHFDQNEAENENIQINGILADPDQNELDIGSPAEASVETGFISESEDFSEAAPIPGFFESSLPEMDSENVPETQLGVPAGSENNYQAEPDDSDYAAVIPAAVSAAQIEAAVANIIERDYAGQIESLVATAIEKVVSLEIERIKSRLFADEED